VYISWYERPLATRKASVDVYTVEQVRKPRKIERLKKGRVFCLMLVMLGLADLITTLVGVKVFGATEANPLLSSITANPLLFSGIKLLAVSLIGVLFYRVGDVEEASSNRVLQLSYSISLVFLTTVITNNLLVVAKLA
jgi:hypothetical protein